MSLDDVGASINIEAIPRFVAWAGGNEARPGTLCLVGLLASMGGRVGGGRSPARFALVVEGNLGSLPSSPLRPASQKRFSSASWLRAFPYPAVPSARMREAVSSAKGAKAARRGQSTERSAAWERWISWYSRRQRRRGRPTASPGTRLSTGQGRTPITVRSPQQIL